MRSKAQRRRADLAASWSLASCLLVSTSVQARPSGPGIVCQSYPDSPHCSGTVAHCSLCHTSTAPAAWNTFGLQVLGALGGESYDDHLSEALEAVASDDADGDGISNADELAAGTLPGDATSVWPYCARKVLLDADVPVAADYDFAHAYARVSVLYCGHSASFDERQALLAVRDERGRQYELLHGHLDDCLASDYWKQAGLQRLADPKIRPLYVVGKDSPSRIVIGDYEWDYRLWTYIMTDDRDMRDLLLADYHVQQSEDGTLERVQGAVTSEDGRTGQPLEPERRAGMITTQWFFAINTMFSPVPRATAAQAYRAYLGQDIAMQEGLLPVPSEPVDIDNRAVDGPVCRDCHSTLDPMSYAFVSYEGIRGAATGSYNAMRASRIPNWKDNQGSLLGQPISSARDFGEVAVHSQLFPRNLAAMFVRHAIEREPAPEEQLEFKALWQGIADDAWSANRLIHRLVDTSMFGGPQ